MSCAETAEPIDLPKTEGSTSSIVFDRWRQCSRRHSVVSCAKTADPIDLPFGLLTPVGRRKHKLNHICQVSPIHLANTIELSRLFNGLFSKTTYVSQHQKGKPFWILLEQEIMVWQWHQLDYMQIICTLLHTDNDIGIGSRPSDHYFRSVCLFVCLCRVFLSRL